jgi:hypothetical protein
VNEEAELPRLTDELLRSIEWRYAVPRSCRVCGAPLRVGSSGLGGIRMGCSSDAASPLKYKHEPAGATWQEALRHWEESVLYNAPEGDLRVIALAKAFRGVRKLAEGALFLRQNGERPPGGNETWHAWDLEAEELLRSFLLPEEEA